MAIIFIDGFDHYALGDMAKKWDDASSWVSTYFDIQSTVRRRAAGQALAAKTSTCFLAKNGTFANNIVYVGFAYYPGDLDGAQWVQFYNADGYQVTVKHATDGSIKVLRGGGAGTLLESSATGIFSAQIWYWVEIKVTIDNSSGTYEVRVNGTDVVSGSSVDTQSQTSAGVTQVRISGTATDSYYDDLYIADDSGSFDFLGDSRVDLILPTGAGATTAWTPSAGSNYENVDDATDIDDDSTYNSEADVNGVDTYAFGNLTALTTPTIHAVAVNVCSRNDDADTHKHKAIARPASTDRESAEFTNTSSYKIYQAIWALNPEDSAAWEEADVNGAEFGIKLTA